ncbi:MAG: arylsulfatase [Alphaproteobacteria bacterium]|nr:arylsulfatase [Alphaproteobacteria bacterium]
MANTTKTDHTAKRPNLLVVVVDDMGWSDLRAFGGEASTRHLDALTARGVRLTNFHTSPVCSTTRAMLMTGCDHHEVGLGCMVEIMTPEQRGKPGYEGYLNDRSVTIAERLRDAGYHTLMSGKWHMGVKKPYLSMPAARGFERSFALVQGEHNHYGADQSPETAGYLGVSQYQHDGMEARFPEGAYSSDCFADRMIEFVTAAKDDPRPLFGYLAFTAPHSPLQAPPGLIAKYRGMYDDGPEAMREKRLARMRDMGLLAALATPAEIRGGQHWNELPPEQRRLESRKMEIYAAMIEAMDDALGRVLESLEATGRLDNTEIIFFSDNGPAGSLREAAPGWREWIKEHADNRFDNIGRANSYVSMGPRWAQAQAAPFFLFKRYTSEGGVRTCGLACGPRIKARTESDAFLHVMDIAPTLLEFAGVDASTPPGKIPLRGVSAAPVLAGTQAEVHAPDERIAWELAYCRGVRKGDWKAIFLTRAAHNISADIPINRWLLYNIARDPGETTDLSSAEPGKLQDLIAAWNEYARECGVVVPENL